MIIDKTAGLDLSKPDSWTAQEDKSWHDFYDVTKGGPLPGLEFWIANERPDILKRYRAQVLPMEDPETYPVAVRAKVGPLTYIHFYTIVGFRDGIRYQINNALAGGARKSEIMASLAVAFLHTGPMGMSHVAATSQEFLATLEEPAQPPEWPAGWDIEPDAFKAGLSYESLDFAPGEVELLEDWYLKVCGEVPSYLGFLAKHRPELLKTWRWRWEHSIGDALPKQMLPLLQLQLTAARGFGQGVREAALMARGLGTPKVAAVDAVQRAMVYGGPSCISVVEDVAGDVFDDASWE